MTPTAALGVPPAPAPMQGMSATYFQALLAALKCVKVIGDMAALRAQ